MYGLSFVNQLFILHSGISIGSWINCGYSLNHYKAVSYLMVHKSVKWVIHKIMDALRARMDLKPL